MDTTPESLEKIFQQVEQESEKRARAEAAARERPEDPAADMVSSETLKTAKQRRRGSVSITRFGQLSDEKLASGPASPTQVSSIASQSAFYRAQSQNASRQSVASRASSGLSAGGGAGEHDEDPNHVTQIHEIVGKQTLSRAVSNLLPRRLSRSTQGQRSMVPSSTIGANMIVGVSVIENTVEAQHEDEQAGRTEQNGTSSPPSGAVVHVGEEPPRTLRTQSSRQSLNAQKPDWKAKAKNFTKKFRRKPSNPDVTVPSAPTP